MSKLYAMIRPTSEYSRQATEKPFPVTLGNPQYDGMVVKGGPGGLYGLSDVFLYVDWGNGKLHLMPSQLATDDAIPTFDVP
jgi:hypothetical protein|tara:strand:+ start:4972 stop:5214 length:243 start_codon:yes stop_codon:yes gene_type:complete